MRRTRTSLAMALGLLTLSGACGWWFSRGFLRQLAACSMGLGH